MIVETYVRYGTMGWRIQGSGGYEVTLVVGGFLVCLPGVSLLYEDLEAALLYLAAVSRR